MQNLTVKQLKDIMKNPIEVYVPTKKINCTSVKFQNRYYRYATDSDDKIIEFMQTKVNDQSETVIIVYTK